MHACIALASKVFRTQKIYIKQRNNNKRFLLAIIISAKKNCYTLTKAVDLSSYFLFSYFIIIAINERQQRNLIAM